MEWGKNNGKAHGPTLFCTHDQGKVRLTPQNKTLLRVPGQGVGAGRAQGGMWGPEPALGSALPGSLQGGVGHKGRRHIPEDPEDAAASSCPTLCLPHPWGMLFLCPPSKSFSDSHSASPLLSKEPLTWCPAYTCPLFPPRWLWHLMNFQSSLYFPLPTPSLSAEPLPLPHTLHWLFHPSFVLCTCLQFNSFLFFLPKPFLQFVALIWILILLSNTFAVPPSSVPPPSSISVLSIPPSMLLMEILNRTDVLPPPQASVSLSAPSEGVQGIFSPQRGGGTSTTDLWGSCDFSRCGQWATKGHTEILNVLLSRHHLHPILAPTSHA